MEKPAAVPVLQSDKSLRFPHALLISASAGSGKTYTLAQRYVQFLLSEKVPNNGLSNILAVTFTNNAAKEMKARILAWLKDLALDRDPAKMEETLALVSLDRAAVKARAAALVDQVIGNYSDFHIQTIDSFLARVMAASVDELKLPLNPEITMSYDLLIDLALYSMFARIGKEDLPASAVDRFLAVLPKTGAYPWNPAERVKENFNSFLNQEGKTEGTIKAIAGDYEAQLKELFAAVMQHCAALRKRCNNPELFKASSLAAIEANSPTDFLACYSFTYGILNGQKKSKFPAGCDKEIETLNALVTDLTELSAQAYYHPYAGIYGRFKEELEKVKRGKTDVIHINDIAQKLSAYINTRNVPEIYLRLGEQISHFLIDEFQDTNRLQWDVIRPLVEESLSKTGSLFVVGDIKQAIYMFRNADYKIMRDLLDKAEGRKAEAKNLSLEPLGGELQYVNLPVNYRSDGEVLAYVNGLFKDKLKNTPELIGQDLTELTSYEQAVLPGRVKDGFVRTDVLELADTSEEKEQKAWLLGVVADARARYPLNEIAILVSKNKRIEPVVEWLAGAGVPVASLSSLDIRKRRVVAELLSLLKFLETPSDDLSFAAFITGDIFTKLTGLSREEMRDFIFKARTAGDPILYASFRNHPKYKEYWDASLDQVFRKVGYLPLYELVSLIYNSFKLFGNFPDEQAFLARFLDAVISLEAEGVTSPRAFIEYAAVLDEDKAKVFSIALPDYIDAVRVMTFHKSKGLGFSVVINLMFEEQAPSDPMYFEEKDGAIHVYHITRAAAEVSAKLRPIYEGRSADSAVQDLNVLYVISTRARHELYNLFVKKVRKTPAKEAKLGDLFQNYRSAGSPRQPVRAEVKPPARPVEIISAGSRPEGHFETLKPTYTSYFETAEGNLVHEVLAQFIAMPKDPAAEVSAQFDRLTHKYSFKFDKPKVVKSLVTFLASPEAAPFFAPGAEVLVEAEFVDRNGSLFRMDRVIIGKDKIMVVDFKTGLENTEKYTVQMKNYLAIISEAYGKPAQGLLAYIDLIKTVVI